MNAIGIVVLLLIHLASLVLIALLVDYVNAWKSAIPRTLFFLLFLTVTASTIGLVFLK